MCEADSSRSADTAPRDAWVDRQVCHVPALLQEAEHNTGLSFIRKQSVLGAKEHKGVLIRSNHSTGPHLLSYLTALSHWASGNLRVSLIQCHVIKTSGSIVFPVDFLLVD